jgi:hypothetical protein
MATSFMTPSAQSSPTPPTALPWPHWMLRYIGTDDQQALYDLVGSVGGSPPYGGISYDEAAAVCDLIEDYVGPGEASAAAYSRVETILDDAPERKRVLDLFRCTDVVTSSPYTYGADTVECGLALARQLAHSGAEATFLSFQAELHHRAGDLPAARLCTMDALAMYLELADEDPAYEHRVQQSAQNAVSFTARAGDKPAARKLLQQLGDLIEPAAAEQLRLSLRDD